MHTYVYDVKMFAMVTFKAPNRKAAEALLERGLALVDLDLADPKLKAAAAADTAVVAFTISVDDVQYPFLTEYDGEDYPHDVDVE